ncbi:hypothetical protein SCLCIDRAFT_393376 [Scleroderma citrinum Foug A]|uniref:Uncharacterized protein n=1 Tax=Scleroderma citrinum Foug A TaxID=1036808 RepID=A0A0C3EDI5_9AGAM|nr:hypothetical protein SCLCIDRAFT_393376 [Scleroderma citrinum Foug A]
MGVFRYRVRIEKPAFRYYRAVPRCLAFWCVNRRLNVPLLFAKFANPARGAKQVWYTCREVDSMFSETCLTGNHICRAARGHDLRREVFNTQLGRTLSMGSRACCAHLMHMRCVSHRLMSTASCCQYISLRSLSTIPYIYSDKTV